MHLSDDAVGISLKSEFYDDIHKHNPIGFFEAHIENYFDGGYHLKKLRDISEHTPITLHGVGLSLGSSDAPSKHDLERRKSIIDDIKPAIFSEHAAWTRSGNSHLNDLLPFPLNMDMVQRISDNINIVQDFIKQPIIIENLSSYIAFDNDTLSDADFMNEVCKKTGCGALLDINNIYVQQYNLGRDAYDYLNIIKPEYVKQYHLAGGEKSPYLDIIIDTHGTDIPDTVMDLYRHALNMIGIRPTLYERDNNIPPFDVMLQEVQRIKHVQNDILGDKNV